MTRRKLVLVGTGGLGRETLWALAERGPGHGPGAEVLGFLTSDAEQHGTEVCGLPVLGDESWARGRSDVAVVCCVGDPRARRALVERFEREGVEQATVVHPSVEMSEHVEVGPGCILGARAVVTSQVRIGRGVVVGAAAVVSHDCVLEDFATLAPGVVLAGGVRVEYAAELGAGATAIPGQVIGRGALVGAQAAVVGPVEANTVVAGVPARVLGRMPDDRRV